VKSLKYKLCFDAITSNQAPLWSNLIRRVVDLRLGRSLCGFIVFTLLLSGCGFTPRGSISGTTNIGTIFVDATRNVPIAELLERQILDRDLVLATSRNSADILLRLTNEIETQRILTVQSEGRVSELELLHSVNLLIAQSEGDQPARYDPSQQENTVTVWREYTYDEKGVLGKEDEASILRAEMREELARRLLLRVVATTRGSSSEDDADSNEETSSQKN